MENKEIIDNLIKNGQIEDQERQDAVGNGNIRVISIRYKLYCIILMILIIIGIFNYVLPQNDKYNQSKQNLQNVKTDVENFENKKKQYENDIKLIETIDNSELKIIDCLNNMAGCEQMEVNIKDNFSEVISYLQVNNLNSPKMNVDEKIILKNINEYLTQENENGYSKNGEINKIAIGDPSEFKESLFYVSVFLNISFNDKDGLLSFINNIERKINPDKDLRILYKIDEISYDINNYDQEQNVDIYLKAFYYKK
ncbi:hypothetical protein K9M48_02745 [Candidatus Gracilibacteria bacterium]|nr:hypothetical protein [Candidatus Gracilibacteria bacterium]